MAGNVYPVRPGDIYVLDQNDRHYLRGGREDLVLVSVFNPPLKGSEKHDLTNPDGSAYSSSRRKEKRPGQATPLHGQENATASPCILSRLCAVCGRRAGRLQSQNPGIGLRRNRWVRRSPAGQENGMPDKSPPQIRLTGGDALRIGTSGRCASTSLPRRTPPPASPLLQPNDPKPGTEIANGKRQVDGRHAAADFDMIDQFIASHHIDLDIGPRRWRCLAESRACWST